MSTVSAGAPLPRTGPKPPAALRAAARRVVAAIDRLGVQLPPPTVVAVRALLRDTASYYSNLIEGRDTHPALIEAARQGVFVKLPALRDNQAQALAHAATQAHFEAALAADPQMNVSSPDVVLGVHEMLSAPNGGRLPAGLDAFAEDYDATRLLDPRAGKSTGDDPRVVALIAAAAAHHRLLSVRPFGDGSGYVARFVTDLLLARLGLAGHGLWSMSRGLARSADLYQRHLAHAGTGPRSARLLHEFCAFFVGVALEEVTYMSGVLALDQLRARVRDYVRARTMRTIPAPGSPAEITPRAPRPGRPALAFRAEAARVLEWLLTVGPLPRRDVAHVAATSDRTARRVITELLAEGLATSATPRGELLPRIPAHAAPYLLPKLLPPTPEFATGIMGS